MTGKLTFPDGFLGVERQLPTSVRELAMWMVVGWPM